MADYSIRLYRDSDYDAVRGLFAEGTVEHTRAAFKHAFTLARVWLSLGVVFVLSLLLSGSFALSAGALLLALVALWFGTRDLYASYVRHALSHDMLDIRRYYLERDGHCFWVAESAGDVVGTVAAVPCSYPGGERHTELKRMSVARSHRGKGIAKALCRTLIDYSRERGSEAVVLETTRGHQAAHSLYKRVGFQWQHSTFLKHPLARAVDFKFFFYKYDIPARRR